MLKYSEIIQDSMKVTYVLITLIRRTFMVQ
jgi:hypothetical protein